ncbi:hypothetical protein HYPDE_27383 [Hyphomicrobium denitrificans 1NES1]|uniref:Uncharacterized protein n=1 Tax=Hyphomicrobium denitrificans 1NES1 TaxID=670307 RepID=N0B9F1_9HYPH|nr:hypothetical protein HYPDE_27383 [Hyphomicrobium denitrificans 1NES1]
MWSSFDDTRNGEAAPAPGRSANDPEALFQEEIRRKQPEGFAAPVDHWGETAPSSVWPRRTCREGAGQRRKPHFGAA